MMKMNEEIKALEKQKKVAIENNNYDLYATLGVKQGLLYALGQTRWYTVYKVEEKSKINEILSDAAKRIDEIMEKEKDKIRTNNPSRKKDDFGISR